MSSKEFKRHKNLLIWQKISKTFDVRSAYMKPESPLLWDNYTNPRNNGCQKKSIKNKSIKYLRKRYTNLN